jgi:hypothetical protein
VPAAASSATPATPSRSRSTTSRGS